MMRYWQMLCYGWMCLIPLNLIAASHPATNPSSFDIEEMEGIWEYRNHRSDENGYLIELHPRDKPSEVFTGYFHEHIFTPPLYASLFLNKDGKIRQFRISLTSSNRIAQFSQRKEQDEPTPQSLLEKLLQFYPELKGALIIRRDSF